MVGRHVERSTWKKGRAHGEQDGRREPQQGRAVHQDTVSAKGQPGPAATGPEVQAPLKETFPPRCGFLSDMLVLMV